MRRVTWATVALLATACASPSAGGDGGSGAAADAGQGSSGPSAAQRAAWALAAADAIEESFLLDRVAVLASDDFAGRDNQTPGGDLARQWLAADLTNQQLSPLFEGGFAQPFAQGTNLCARVPGSDPALADEAVVVGAHFDHLGTAGVPGSQCKAAPKATDLICNGAVDNAAGVAVAIAVTRGLAAHPPRRSVVLCLFDAEEDGLLGSKHFVAAAAKPGAALPLANIAAMLSVDNVGSALLPGDMSSFAVDAEFSVTLRAAVKAANEATGVQTFPVSSFFVGQEGGGRSDHLPFREAGVPVLFLGSGSSSVYHTPADDEEAVIPAKLRGIARHATVMVAAIANANARPDLVKKPGPMLEDAEALVSMADKVLAYPAALGLNDTQVDLVKQWRTDLAAWLATPPATEAEWESYQSLVKGILKAVYLVVGG